MKCGVFQLLHLFCLFVWLILAIGDEISATAAETSDSVTEDETITFELEHAFGESQEFTKRANVPIRQTKVLFHLKDNILTVDRKFVVLLAICETF